MNPPVVAPNTREQLLETAADLLQRVGYASFSFRDLADAVGIRAASVHYHFPTKADLGLALVDWFRAHSDPKIAELCQANPNIRDRLLALAEHVAEHTCVSGKSCPINLLLSEFSVLPENLQIKVRSWVDDCITGMSQWLEQGRSAGELFFPGDAISQARLVWSVIEHGTQLARTHPDQPFGALMLHLVATMTPIRA
jgi:TetR/AcrR family transcriptional regulator, transcriptional repressor for nem operon